MTFCYAFIQFFFWFAYGTAVNFCSVYLLACGLSNTAIGILSASACALSVLISPLLASFADRQQRVTVRHLLLFFSLCQMLLSLLMFLSYGKGAVPNALLLGLVILLVQVGLPFTNALATQAIHAGRTFRFSLARGFGSLGYAVMSFTVGQLAAVFGPGCLPLVILGSSLLLLCGVLCFPALPPAKASSDPSPASGVLRFLTRYPGFPETLLGCTLLYTSHAFINSFVFQIVTFKGGNSASMGVVMGLAGLLEILAMVFFPLLEKKREAVFWFRLCGFFFMLKSLLTLLAPGIPPLYAVQLLQPFGWGIMTVSSVYYVNRRMQPQDMVKGQTVMTMTLSLGTIAGSLIGGPFLDRIGVPGMLVIAVIFGALGAVIVFRHAVRK